MSTTRSLAEYAAKGTFDSLPDKTIQSAKVAILNILAAAIGGARTTIGQHHVNLACATGGGISEASLIGTNHQVSVAMASYANSSLAFALDYEDVVHYCIHAGPVTVPAALALGEKLASSGKDFIVAIERGYEIGTRVGLAMQPSAERGAQVWGQQYTPFAPCIAASSLLRLDARATEVAMGIAGTYAPVPSAYKYFGLVEETRPMREAKLGWGWMSLGGVFGALSAAQGMQGGFGILDGDEGFWIMAGSDQCDHTIMTANLGETHYIEDTEYKVHPSIAWNHPVHVALTHWMEKHPVIPNEIVSVHVCGLGISRIADNAPAGPVDAMFSLPYTVATTLLGDPLLPEMYDPLRIKAPEVQALLAKITCQADEVADLAWFNEHRMCYVITLKLRDGNEFILETEFPRDKPDIGWTEIETKFRELAVGSLKTDVVDQVIEMVDTLEDLNDVGRLAKLLTT